MKIILTGSTGGIGLEVLRQCLDHPEITSIVVLSRRDVPEAFSTNPKVHVIIMTNFNVYSEEVLQQLMGAKACIWALGGPAFRYPDYTTAKTVNVDYVDNAATTFARSLSPHLEDGHKFHFIYVSGHSAVRDQAQKLWMFEDSRKIKGLAENKLIAVENNHPERFASYLFRPGSVIPPGIPWRIAGALTRPIQDTVGVEALAATMINVAIQGWNTHVIEHDTLRSKGEDLLRSS
ncbi:hypothetical protein N7492_000406 [Penicillium capsulatum]|uniref:NAD(P)-binding domain-containing protein n=1 Tax=Penicillium capsulatum TaxID=69766 RepID=A0A9W9ITG7_9EURO|nr:hypothetical protein N7492_000406 [Penicillium capsulatum]KAJ6130532.1 hypothetical protein N7512_003312 [Penicillium capsulatum]